MKRSLSHRSSLERNFRYTPLKIPQRQPSRPPVQLPLPPNLVADILGFLELDRIVSLRQVNRTFKDRVVPNAYQEVVIDQDSIENSPKATIVTITAASSICTVTFKNINLSNLNANACKTFTTILEQLRQLHGQKIRTVALVGIKVSSIFDVEQFVKHFMGKVIQQHGNSFSELIIRNC